MSLQPRVREVGGVSVRSFSDPDGKVFRHVYAGQIWTNGRPKEDLVIVEVPPRAILRVRYLDSYNAFPMSTNYFRASYSLVPLKEGIVEGQVWTDKRTGSKVRIEGPVGGGYRRFKLQIVDSSEYQYVDRQDLLENFLLDYTHTKEKDTAMSVQPGDKISLKFYEGPNPSQLSDVLVTEGTEGSLFLQIAPYTTVPLKGLLSAGWEIIGVDPILPAETGFFRDKTGDVWLHTDTWSCLTANRGTTRISNDFFEGPAVARDYAPFTKLVPESN
jgi:hypothetical protein